MTEKQRALNLVRINHIINMIMEDGLMQFSLESLPDRKHEWAILATKDNRRIAVSVYVDNENDEEKAFTKTFYSQDASSAIADYIQALDAGWKPASQISPENWIDGLAAERVALS